MQPGTDSSCVAVFMNLQVRFSGRRLVLPKNCEVVLITTVKGTHAFVAPSMNLRVRLSGRRSRPQLTLPLISSGACKHHIAHPPRPALDL